jgi:hypothetical protein
MSSSLFDYDLGQIGASKVPAWVKEGAAMGRGGHRWQLTPDNGLVDQVAQTPDKSLYSRAYDAIGIYDLLRLTNVDPWSIMDDHRTHLTERVCVRRPFRRRWRSVAGYVGTALGRRRIEALWIYGGAGSN